MKKILRIYDVGFWEFEIPEEFSEAVEAHPVEHWFNLLDGSVEDLDSIFIWYVEADCLIRDVELKEKEEE